MRRLFLCNTVYQLLVVLWMQYRIFPNEKADILITDHSFNKKGILNSLKKSNLFDNCYYAKTFSFARWSKWMSTNEINFSIRQPNLYLRKFCKINKSYDQIFISNTDYFSRLLFNAVLNKNNNCELHLYEDGLSTYTVFFEKRYHATNTTRYRTKNPTKQNVNFEKRIFNNVSSIFLFNPQLLQWQPNFQINPIPKIDINDTIFIQLCNEIYGYTKCNESFDKYNERFVFFEESFAREGTPINDLQLMEQIADIVGKENIIVKTHPRSTEERFKKNGFKTNNNKIVPWEIIALNLTNIEDKIFIGICSGSMFNPKLIFDLNVNVISLYNLIPREYLTSLTFSDDFWGVFEKIFTLYPKNFKHCNGIQDFYLISDLDNH